MNPTAEQIVSDAVLAQQGDVARKRMAREIAAYALGMLILIDGPEKAAETGYKMVDRMVGQKP